ncbi:MAG: hypothetical protein PVJ67_04145 [Candidatus Pacearchaeota archaeon]|jgi:hypothetical protein
MEINYPIHILKKEFVRLGQVYSPRELGKSLSWIKKRKAEILKAIKVLEENNNTR